MKVGLYYSNSDIRIVDQPVPSIGPGELLLRVKASGICGSDLMEWYRAYRAPLVLGHELAGEVAAVGNGVKDVKAGDRIAATHHVPCLTCHFCRAGHETTCDMLRETSFDPGGFAEYVRVPAPNVLRGTLKLPDGVTYDDGAFLEPLACALRGLRLAHFREGQTVLILGTGVSGLVYLKAALALGAGRIVGADIHEFRLEAARRFGAEKTFHAGKDLAALVRTVNDGRLADLVILCASARPAITQAFSTVERGGTVLVSAPAPDVEPVPIPFNDLFWRNEITITSTYGAAPADSALALSLLRAGRVRVNELITHRVPLTDLGRGFQLAGTPDEVLKVMVEP